MTHKTPQEIQQEAQDALQRFVSGKPVMNSPADPNSDDIKIQKALALLQEFLDEKKLSTYTKQDRYGKEL
jgi:hypothetical protein